ncbi:MAG: alpha/beta hydrolase [Myxococcales bacterium]|nr:alpha/beta hydrolase [Myxococcales bacterium]
MAVHSKPGEKVWFYAGTDRIAGLLWIPEGMKDGERLPAIVIARGFGSVKEFINPGFAPVLNDAGYIVLGFDYRGVNESEGMPGRLIPTEHAEDIRAGISFLQTLSQVDPEKIGLLGDSMGASHVIYAAAHDPRAKCVISYGGPGDGDRWFRSLVGYERYLGWKARIEAERLQRVITGKSTYVSAFDFLSFSQREREEWEGMRKSFPATLPDITLETVEAYLEYKPEQFVAQISPRAVMLVTVATSVVVPPDEAVSLYEKALEPKKLWIIPPASASFRYATHMEGHGYSGYLADAFIDWFKQWIPPERGA